VANEPVSSVTEPTSVPLGSKVVLVVSTGPAATYGANAAVPGVLGRPQAAALEAMQAIGLNAQVFTETSQEYEWGAVVSQWPKAGQLAASGSNAALLVSTGPAVEGTALTRVPAVIGTTEADARAALERAGLHAATVGVFSPTVAEGIVVGQLPEERTVAPPPAKSKAWMWILAVLAVLLVVLAAVWFAGRDQAPAEMVRVPGVVGMAQPKAEEAITAVGLEVGRITESPSTTATAGAVMSQDPAKGDEVEKGSRVDLVVATASDLVVVPDVTGMSKDDALQELARAQLKVSTTEAPSDSVPAGDVMSQSPKAGQQVPPDTEVGIVVSNGPKNVSVPDVSGMTKTEAEQEIGDAGLVAKSVEGYSTSVPADQVISQTPPSGASVAPGTQVALLISKGPEPAGTEMVKVPSVVGEALSDAKSTLTSAGFKVVSYEMDGSGKPADQVLYQNPAAGLDVAKGSEIALLVSSGQ